MGSKVPFARWREGSPVFVSYCDDDDDDDDDEMSMFPRPYC